MAINTILFDVGNTLIYPQPSVAQTFTDVANRRGYSLRLSDVKPHIPAMEAIYEEEYAKDGDFWCSHEGSVKVWMDQYRFLSHALGLEHDADWLAENTHVSFSYPDHWALFLEVKSVLLELKRREYCLGIVSNWDAGLEQLLRGLGLLPFFDVVISSAVVGYRKPNPIIFDLACEALRVSPESCMHVGDSVEADGDGALSAGITPLIIDRNDAHQECGYRRVVSLEGIEGVLLTLR